MEVSTTQQLAQAKQWVKAVGRFDPFYRTRWVASYLGAPLRASRGEALKDMRLWLLVNVPQGGGR